MAIHFHSAKSLFLTALVATVFFAGAAQAQTNLPPCGPNPFKGVSDVTFAFMSNCSLPQNAGANVLSAFIGTYGKNCGQRTSNVSPDLKASCNGKHSCEYTVDTKAIGDPAPGCAKTYSAIARCTNGDQHTADAPAEANGAKIVLTCN